MTRLVFVSVLSVPRPPLSRGPSPVSPATARVELTDSTDRDTSP